MQAVFKMIRFLYKMTIRLVMIYIVFLVMAWALLGEPFSHTWNLSVERTSSFFGKLTGFADDTATVAEKMGQAAQKQLDSAKDRFHGIDPYEGVNEKLSKDIQQAQ